MAEFAPPSVSTNPPSEAKSEAPFPPASFPFSSGYEAPPLIHTAPTAASFHPTVPPQPSTPAGHYSLPAVLPLPSSISLRPSQPLYSAGIPSTLSTHTYQPTAPLTTTASSTIPTAPPSSEAAYPRMYETPATTLAELREATALNAQRLQSGTRYGVVEGSAPSSLDFPPSSQGAQFPSPYAQTTLASPLAVLSSGMPAGMPTTSSLPPPPPTALAPAPASQWMATGTSYDLTADFPPQPFPAPRNNNEEDSEAASAHIYADVAGNGGASGPLLEQLRSQQIAGVSQYGLSPASEPPFSSGPRSSPVPSKYSPPQKHGTSPEQSADGTVDRGSGKVLSAGGEAGLESLLSTAKAAFYQKDFVKAKSLFMEAFEFTTTNGMAGAVPFFPFPIPLPFPLQNYQNNQFNVLPPSVLWK